MFQAEVADDIKTQILCSITFLSKIVPFEIMWGGKKITDCIVAFSTATMVTRTRLSVTL